jgi:ABC-type uncharacterized transport system substrate-binding protein
MKRLIKESGIRDINNIAKRYKKAKIYFHQDLDGVTTAIAMKNYLEQHGIEVVDAEVIQYGDKEFAIKKPEGEGDVMPVTVNQCLLYILTIMIHKRELKKTPQLVLDIQDQMWKQYLKYCPLKKYFLLTTFF